MEQECLKTVSERRQHDVEQEDCSTLEVLGWQSCGHCRLLVKSVYHERLWYKILISWLSCLGKHGPTNCAVNWSCFNGVGYEMLYHFGHCVERQATKIDHAIITHLRLSTVCRTLRFDSRLLTVVRGIFVEYLPWQILGSRSKRPSS